MDFDDNTLESEDLDQTALALLKVTEGLKLLVYLDLSSIH